MDWKDIMATANITIENGLFGVDVMVVNYKSFDSLLMCEWLEMPGKRMVMYFVSPGPECLDGIHTMRYILFHVPR